MWNIYNCLISLCWSKILKFAWMTLDKRVSVRVWWAQRYFKQWHHNMLFLIAGGMYAKEKQIKSVEPRINVVRLHRIYDCLRKLKSLLTGNITSAHSFSDVGITFPLTWCFKHGVQPLTIFLVSPKNIFFLLFSNAIITRECEKLLCERTHARSYKWSVEHRSTY